MWKKFLKPKLLVIWMSKYKSMEKKQVVIYIDFYGFIIDN